MGESRSKRAGRYDALRGADGSRALGYEGIVRTEQGLHAKFRSRASNGKPSYMLWSQPMLDQEAAKGKRAHPDALRALRDLRISEADILSGKTSIDAYKWADPRHDGTSPTAPVDGIHAPRSAPSLKNARLQMTQAGLGYRGMTA